MANPEEEDITEDEISDDRSSLRNAESETLLSGLHAKLYVADAGWGARVWTGSANATNAAFRNNIEFLVELVGSKSQCGINAILSPSEKGTSLGDLLQDFAPGEQAEVDSEQKELEKKIDDVRLVMARKIFSAQIIENDEPETFNIKLQLEEDDSLNITSAIKMRCWPITLQEAAGVNLNRKSNIVAEFKRVSFEALTSFFSFELTAANEREKRVSRFVFNIPLVGAPSNRKERILHSILRGKDNFIRFLIFLLAEGGADARKLLFASQSHLLSKSGANKPHSADFPLFESLVKALDRNPAKLDNIARVVEDFRKTPEGSSLLPDGFDAIWGPIWSARKRQKR